MIYERVLPRDKEMVEKMEEERSFAV